MRDAQIPPVRCQTGQRLTVDHAGNDVLAAVHHQQRAGVLRARADRFTSPAKRRAVSSPLARSMRMFRTGVAGRPSAAGRGR
jgi:hypothetical protein